MKRIRKVILFVFFIILFSARFGCATEAERIIYFNSEIEVHRDSTMTVIETIKVFAQGDKIKRGIYRDFPTEYKDLSGNVVKVGFKVITVLKDGIPEDYHIKKQSNGKRVYIGQANRYLNQGEYTYTIVYETNRQLGFFETHDELYWNVNGLGWEFRIEDLSATVRLPNEVSDKVYVLKAYGGASGDSSWVQGKQYSVETEPTTGRIIFKSNILLRPQEGMTIVIGWPKGFITEPSRKDYFKYYLNDNPEIVRGACGLFLVFVYYLLIWYFVGKDPKKGTIIPLYEPPKGFSPSAVRYVMNMGYDEKVFAVAVIDMAVQGLVKIIPGKLLGSKYTLIKQKDDIGQLHPEERIAFNKLLIGRDRIELTNSNHLKISDAINGIKLSMNTRFEKIYFYQNSLYFLVGLMLSIGVLIYSRILLKEEIAVYLPISIFMLIFLGSFFIRKVPTFARAVTRNTALFIVVLAGSIFGVYFLQKKIWLMLGAPESILSLGIIAFSILIIYINMLFYFLLKAPTVQGRKIMDQIDGFKMYLSVAEKDRLNLLNPPENTPELFEKYLPYALALDVEQKWSERFSEILEKASYHPTWYSDSNWSTHNIGSFSSGLGSHLSSTISSASVAPGSSSGGGFSGGGGSSGGGGGGGGGGGW